MANLHATTCGLTWGGQHDRDGVEETLKALGRVVYSVEEVGEDSGNEEVADAE